MRVNIKLETHGTNLASMMKSLLHEWQELVDDDKASLPADAELEIYREAGSVMYTAKCTARIKTTEMATQ
jgi:hypothetical protein